jgi:ABC-type lipoprotein release transport system permease subunit
MYTLKNLRRRSSRTVLTVTGVSLAITLAMIMFSISEGIRESTDEIIEESGIDLLVVSQGGDIFFGAGEFTQGRTIANDISKGKLFSMDRTFIQNLDSGIIDDDLIDEFEDNDQDIISGSALTKTDSAHWEIVEDTRSYNIEDNGTVLNVYDPLAVQMIKGTYPVLRERMYITANRTSPQNEIPKVTSILATGSSREVSAAFGLADVIKGDFLPTPQDPFYAGGTYNGGEDSDNFTHEILLNSILADYLDVDIGDTVYLSTQLPTTVEDFGEWMDNTTYFRVEGILTKSFEDEGGMAVTVHLSELQYITGKHIDDKADMIIVDLNNPKDAEEVKLWLEEDFEKKGEITAFTQEDIKEEIERFTSIYRGFSEMVAGITILVALLFTSTVIMISVKERTGELCALRALGFSRTSIFKLVLTESVLICMIGFAFGVVFGAIGTEIINAYAEEVATSLPEGFKIAKITPSLLLRATGSVTILGVLVGLIPAYWASRLNIIEALKSE